MKEISLATLERLETIAKDKKKEFAYNIEAREWAWYNHDEHGAWDWHKGFSTRFDALVDSVFSYLDPIDDEEFMNAYENG